MHMLFHFVTKLLIGFFGLYPRVRDYNDPHLLRTAIALRIKIEVNYSCNPSKFADENSDVDSFVAFQVAEFIEGMFTSLRELVPVDDSYLAIWSEVFKLHCILHSVVLRLLQFNPLGRRLSHLSDIFLY